MKKNLLIFFAVFLISLIKAQVIPNIDWVKYFAQKGAISTFASALDANNNVYVTGYIDTGTNKDLVVLKYDSLGTLLWSHNYDNGGDDYGNAIKVDPSGNVYVTGGSYDGTTGDDFITLWYDPAGNLTNSDRYDGSGGNGADTAKDCSIDLVNGYLYVSGTSYSSNGNLDITIVQYKLSGSTPLWYYDYNGSGNSDDFAVSMAGSGGMAQVFVTGIETGSNYDMVTLSVDKTGTLVWAKAYDGTASQNDKGNAVIVAGANVVVCGEVYNNSTLNDYTIVKYDASNGSLIWQNDYDFNADRDAATGLTKDIYGNIAVTGIALNGGGDYEYHTLMYDSTGVMQWDNGELSGLNAITVTPRIATDTVLYHFYVSGEIQNSTHDAVVYQVDPTGTTRWKKSVDGGAHVDDAAINLAVSGWGVVFLSANCWNGSAYDLTTIKISQTPVYFPIDMNGEAPNERAAYLRNLGQLHDSAYSQVNKIKYYNTEISPAIFIQETQNSFQFLKSSHSSTQRDSIYRIDLRFDGPGASKFPELFSYEPVDAYTNFYTPNTGPHGITNLNAQRRLLVPNIYPNVDLHYYSNQDGLKYYFVVKPGGSPSSIFLSFNGCGTSFINGSNELIATAGWDNLKFKQPDVYQISTSLTVVPVGTASWSALGGNAYGVSTPSYNPTLPLVVMISRPAALLSVAQTTFWSTYLGSYGDDVALDVATDNVGNVFVAGYTTDALLFQNVVGNVNGVKGSQDAVVHKFSSQAELRWSHIYGGSGVEEFRSVAFSGAFQAQPAIWLTGYTTSNQIKANITPSNNPNDGSHWDNVAAGASDALIVQLRATSGAIDYAQYLGGTEDDKGTSIAVDDNLQRVYIVGKTDDGNGGNANSWPLKNPGGNSYFNGAHNNTGNSAPDGFIFTMSMIRQPLYSTFIGGNGSDIINEVAVNQQNGYIYLTGSTSSSLSVRSSGGPYAALNNSMFPVCASPGGYFQSAVSSSVLSTGYIARLNSNFELYWSTLFNGDGDGAGTGIDVAPNGDLFATGFSYSTKSSTINCGVPTDNGFPSCNAFQTAAFGQNGAYADIYLARFNNAHFMTYSTLYGNNDDENPAGTLGLGGHPKLCVEKNNNVFVTGVTRRDNSTSNAFPTLNKSGLYNQAANAGTAAVLSEDAFMLWFDANNQRTWATCYGGGDPSAFASGDEVGNGVAIFGSLQLYMVGTATSYNLPYACPSSTGTPYCKNNNSNSYDAFLARFDMGTFIGIKENGLFKTENELAVYPNPTNNELNIGFKSRELDDYSIEVYSVLGQLLYKKHVGKVIGFHTETLNLSQYKSGIYIVNLTSAKEVVSKKVIKE